MLAVPGPLFTCWPLTMRFVGVPNRDSMNAMLGRAGLADKTFLDVGCGSGLFSLVARRSGARVSSIDYDPECVACAAELKRRYFPDDENWTIREGSALDGPYLESLGKFDVVYSWGVLHHTGDMWKAVGLAAERVKHGGTFFISIYNDQGGGSRRWLKIKQFYNRMADFSKPFLVLFIACPYEAKYALARLVNGRNPLPFADWRRKSEDRGMSVWHDWVDWCGGLPFQVAKPEEILSFLRKRDFILEDLITCGGGWGCNQFVFKRATIP